MAQMVGAPSKIGGVSGLRLVVKPEHIWGLTDDSGPYEP